MRKVYKDNDNDNDDQDNNNDNRQLWIPKVHLSL